MKKRLACFAIIISLIFSILSASSVSAANPVNPTNNAALQLVSQSETENSNTFKLKLCGDDNQHSASWWPSAAYLHVSLSGNPNTKMMSATVTRYGSSRNTNLTIELQSHSTGTAWKTQRIATNVTLYPSASKTISCKSTLTKYWRVKVYGKFINTDAKYCTYSFLYNKKCVRYPNYTEPYTGKTVTVPPTGYRIYNNKRNSSFRKNYISWFEKKYPKANINWKNYEIHHMRPLKYGGSNNISNGIALTKAQHNKYTTWWLSY